MNKRDFLRFSFYEYFEIEIESTDPNEVSFFYKYLIDRLGKDDHDRISPEGYYASKQIEKFTRNFTGAEVIGRKKEKKEGLPYYRDIHFELLCLVFSRDWKPFEGMNLFVR